MADFVTDFVADCVTDFLYFLSFKSLGKSFGVTYALGKYRCSKNKSENNQFEIVIPTIISELKSKIQKDKNKSSQTIIK